jgi:uncharacterized ion transporter superfamily protein YfcC
VNAHGLKCIYFKQNMKTTSLPNSQDRKLTRLNKYVAMVAFLWFVASLALLLFAGSSSAHATQPKLAPHHAPAPARQMTMVAPSMFPAEF